MLSFKSDCDISLTWQEKLFVLIVHETIDKIRRFQSVVAFRKINVPPARTETQQSLGE